MQLNINMFIYNKSVRNRCVIEFFGGVFMLSRWFLSLTVGVGAFVIGLSQISSFFSCSEIGGASTCLTLRVIDEIPGMVL